MIKMSYHHEKSICLEVDTVSLDHDVAIATQCSNSTPHYFSKQPEGEVEVVSIASL